jgi:PIN domain nuclease of toxin-antitoxin system
VSYLLDSQAFLWWSTAPERLSAAALAICSNRQNVLILSVASVWEMQIKSQLGKLALTPSLEYLVQHQQQANNLQVLPVLLPHIYGLAALPPHHKDPFDRILIAQAMVEGYTVVSADRIFRRYAVPLVW